MLHTDESQRVKEIILQNFLQLTQLLPLHLESDWRSQEMVPVHSDLVPRLAQNGQVLPSRRSECWPMPKPSKSSHKWAHRRSKAILTPRAQKNYSTFEMINAVPAAAPRLWRKQTLATRAVPLQSSKLELNKLLEERRYTETIETAGLCAVRWWENCRLIRLEKVDV